MIAADGDKRFVQLKLNEAFFARRKGFHTQQADTRQGFARPGEDFQAHVVPYFDDGIPDQADGGVHTGGGGICGWDGNHVPAVDILDGEVVKVDGRPISGGNLLELVIMVLQTADATGFTAGQADDLISQGKAAVEQGARDNCAKARKREHPVHRQARAVEVAFLRSFRQNFGEFEL